jgi:hypothetical protein
MKPSPGILIVVALLVTLLSATPSATGASSPLHLRANCAALVGALPLPILYLRFSRAAVIFELGYRPACFRTASEAQPIALSLTLTRSGRAVLQLRSRRFRLALPRPSV